MGGMFGGGNTIYNSATRIEALDLQSSAYGVTVPIVYGQAKLAGNLLWYGGFKSHEHRNVQRTGKGGGGSKTVTITYTYSASVALALCEGVVSKIHTVWRGDSVYTKSALSELGLGLMTGEIGQPEWATIGNIKPEESVPYSGLAYITGTDYDLGDSAQVANHLFEVQSKLAYSVSSKTPDVNPADITKDLLSSDRYGARFDVSRIEFSEWKEYCTAAGILMSPSFTEQNSAASVVDQMGKLTNCAPVWIVDHLKMVPYCEESISGAYGSYTPTMQPVYDLNDDHFLPLSGDGEPIELETLAQADAKNHIQVEFTNRANSYSVEVTDAQDQADIDVSGKRSAEITQAHWICESSVARKVAQLLLQRSLYIRTKYRFTLPWTFALLEPMDIVTLTDSGLGLERTPVRITSIEETSDGTLKIEAEELLYGAASAPAYESESGLGFSHDYAVDPGNVEAPQFFELPAAETSTGLEVAIAVKGKGQYWGGCTVHFSLDGDTYKSVGQVWFGARYGKILTLVNDTVEVQLVAGEMDEATPEESEALNTLLWIGGDSQEYMGYGSTVLTGESTYELGYLNRGAYKTFESMHNILDPCVLVENSRLGRTGALPLSMIGKTIYFKFTSFNVYGAAEQSLADVVAYEYVVTGAMAKLPPTTSVDNLQSSLEEYGISLSWDPHPEPDVTQYELRLGANWNDALHLGFVGGTSSRQKMQTAGTYVFWVAPIDAFGNVGPAASTTIKIEKPVVKSVTGEIVKGLLNLNWETETSSFPVLNYQIYWIQDGVEEYLGKSLTTTFSIDVVYKGTRTFEIKAIDAVGNVSEAVTVDIEVVPPSRPLGLSAQVVDNNVMLYWRDPDVGSLPIQEYLIKEGDSWESGRRIGSNGNSNFVAIFEKRGGSKHYWMAAIDTAGNQGEITSLDVNVYEPPDYELQSSKDLDLSLIGPGVNYANGFVYAPCVTETWSEHFSIRGWSNPQDQVDDGYPIYAQPTSLSAATQTWEIDYGAVMPSVSVDVTLNSEVLAGEVDVICQIYYKTLAEDPWVAATEKADSVYLSGFQFIKVELIYQARTDASLIVIKGVNVSLSVKKKTDSGEGFSSAEEAEGVWIPFSIPFIDAETPVVQAVWTPPDVKIAVVDFEDVPNPKGFRVLVFDTNGHRVDGHFSWTCRGY